MFTRLKFYENQYQKITKPKKVFFVEKQKIVIKHINCLMCIANYFNIEYHS